MDALKAIFCKRDTRSFTDEPVDGDTLGRILQAGRMAEARRTRNRALRRSSERDHTEELASCGQFSSWIPQAPVNIAVVVPPEGRDFNAGRAAQNMLVAANAFALASCPVTMHDQDCARRVLGLPDDYKVAIVLAVGHPRPTDRSPGWARPVTH